MSYILEALKKAQAERQLGSAPTLHAPTLQAQALDGALPWWRRPLVLAALVMAVVIVVLLALVLRPASPVPAPVSAVAPAGGPAAAAPPANVSAATASPAAASALTVTLAPNPVALPAPLPVPEATSTVTMHPAVAPSGGTSSTRTAPATAATTAALTAPATASTPAGASPASEEPVLNLRELPEPIQRSIPHVTVGGYIYSRNPADRLLLIDKVLRHEGEEVAPGLLLEKLLPREAVFSFKGYRYRVPY